MPVAILGAIGAGIIGSAFSGFAGATIFSLTLSSWETFFAPIAVSFSLSTIEVPA